MDVLDPEHAPGVGTPVRGGITYREAHLAMEMLAEPRRSRSLEVVEVNPILDEHNATGSLAVELVLLGPGRAHPLAAGRSTQLWYRRPESLSGRYCCGTQPPLACGYL